LNERERKLEPFLTKHQLDGTRIHNGKPFWLSVWAKLHIAKSTEHAAVTVGNNIYFPKGEYHDGEAPDDLPWLAHEIFHVDQYHSGELTLIKYAEEAAKHGIETGNKYEDAANSFAARVTMVLAHPPTQAERELGP
jgi:hypothetical protein